MIFQNAITLETLMMIYKKYASHKTWDHPNEDCIISIIFQLKRFCYLKHVFAFGDDDGDDGGIGPAELNRNHVLNFGA